MASISIEIEMGAEGDLEDFGLTPGEVSCAEDVLRELKASGTLPKAINEWSLDDGATMTVTFYPDPPEVADDNQMTIDGEPAVMSTLQQQRWVQQHASHATWSR